MPSTYGTPDSQEPEMEVEPAPVLLPSDMWSFMYLVHGPNVLSYAVRANPERVAQIFASHQSPVPLAPAPLAPEPTPAAISQPPPIRISPPSITPYNGESSSLRAFCSQLVNQIQSSQGQFHSELDKVRFAYQCLGSGALAKMRSSFRCLEDPSVPAEITTLEQFISALKQRCQDPGLSEKSTRFIDPLQQETMRFHDFITLFEDNMTDSTYGHLDKENWRVMLKRRLSKRLRNALVMAPDVPKEYHKFVTYLREKDAEFHEINASHNSRIPKATPPQPQISPYPSLPLTSSTPKNLTVSQGGSAMDLDVISKEKGPDGRLTLQAKEARRKLGHCLRCNQPGHFARYCPLGNHNISSITPIHTTEPEPLQLKDQLQQ